MPLHFQFDSYLLPALYFITFRQEWTTVKVALIIRIRNSSDWRYGCSFASQTGKDSLSVFLLVNNLIFRGLQQWTITYLWKHCPSGLRLFIDYQAILQNCNRKGLWNFNKYLLQSFIHSTCLHRSFQFKYKSIFYFYKHYRYNSIY